MFRTRAIASIAQPVRASLARTYASTVTVASTRSNASAPMLGNIEASWKDLSATEQAEIQEQIAELEKKDWKELSVDEKKAGELGCIDESEVIRDNSDMVSRSCWTVRVAQRTKPAGA